VSLTLNGSAVLGYVFNGLVVDGDFGTFGAGAASFDVIYFETDDMAFANSEDNALPVTDDDFAATDEETPIIIDVLANDSDVDLDDLTLISATQGGQGGIVTIVDGQINYDPRAVLDRLAAGETVNDVFAYTVSDGNGAAVSGSVTVVVTGINDAPVTAADDAVLYENEIITIDVLSNDSDVDSGDSLNIVSVDLDPAFGSVSIIAGQVVYDPAGAYDYLTEGQQALLSFNYTIADAYGVQTVGSVTLTVIGIADQNVAPVALDDYFLIREDQTLPFKQWYLRANDADPDGDTITVTNYAQPEFGSLTFGGWGRMYYKAPENFTGIDSFVYTVEDGRGGVDTATVHILVTAENDAPIGQADDFTAYDNVPLTISTANLLSNDTDVEDDVISLVSFTQAANGSVVNNGNGTLTYTSVDGFVGTDTFTYIVSDGILDSAAITVSIDVGLSLAGEYTYTMDEPLVIPDNGFIVSMITVEDSYTLLDLNIELNISHTRNSDLRVVLVAPNGTAIELFDARDLTGQNLVGAQFDDSATATINSSSAPFSGIFLPLGDLSSIEGINVAGTWTLEIYDGKRNQSGTLESWSITATRGNALFAAEAAVFDSDADELAVISQAEIDSTVAAILADWVASGEINAEEQAALSSYSYLIADLEGQTLGLATADTIYIDTDAAGHGWFVDATPDDSDEFVLDGTGMLVGIAGSSAANYMDLRTVLEHEMKHVLGDDHSDDTNDLMGETLDVGTRLIDETAEESETPDPDFTTIPPGMLNRTSNSAGNYNDLAAILRTRSYL
jgi:VCBS repeat-containing protein